MMTKQRGEHRVAEGGLWVPRSVSLVLASESRG